MINTLLKKSKKGIGYMLVGCIPFVGVIPKANAEAFASFKTYVESTVQTDKTVKGQIKDENGEPLPGATIMIKGTTTGTVTDFDGNYSITLTEGASVLVVSFVGYADQEISLNGRSVVDFSMSAEANQLDEVVVVGYGVQKKSDLTGAVSSLKIKDAKKIAAPNPAAMLQGRVSGVSVTSSSSPGAAPVVKIRGLSSLGGSKPLYVVDGVPSDSYFVNPDDIESIEVLKDASSAAIYGTRAAGGVILITTKTGKKNQKTTIDFNAYSGVQNIISQVDMADTESFLKVQAAMNDGVLPEEFQGKQPHNTDWQKEITRDNALQQSYNLAIRGGGENATYSVTGGYFNQEGLVKTSGSERYNFRFKSSINKGNLTIKPNIAYTNQKNKFENLSYGQSLSLYPTTPVYDRSKPSGYGYATKFRNVVGDLENKRSSREYDHIQANLQLDYKILESLNLTVRGGLEKRKEQYYYRHKPFQVSLVPAPNDTFQVLTRNNYHYSKNTGEAFLTFNKEINDHSFSLMAGTSAESIIRRADNVEIIGRNTDNEQTGFPNESTDSFGGSGGTGTNNVDGGLYETKYASFFGRVNYNYDDRYLLQASLRRDASSKFADNYRWGNFPSASIAWNLHNEAFLENLEQVSQLKLRAGYGILGNDRTVGSYDRFLTFGPSRGTWSYVLGKEEKLLQPIMTRQVPNENLKWEETRDLNIGLDFGLYQDKLTGSIDYYNKETKDALMTLRVPTSDGVLNPTTNVASIENQGIDLMLSYQDKFGDFDFGLSGTLTTIDNKVTKLYREGENIAGYEINYQTNVNETRVGESIGSFYAVQSDGIFQSMDEVMSHTTVVDGKAVLLQPKAKPGDVRYIDSNQDGLIDYNGDKVYRGKYIADLEYGINLNLGYKGFDLSLFFQGVAGNQIFNTEKYFAEGVGLTTLQNTTQEAANNFWTPERPNTDIPRADLNSTNVAMISDRFIEDGDYLRLKNVQLGYSLPKSILESANIQKLRFYVSSDNLFTITDYTGRDPEINSAIGADNDGNYQAYSLGIAYPGYPMSRTVIFGLQLTF